MIVFLNGHFVTAEQAVVSVQDRGFLYGDGLFETIPIYGRRPFRWQQHLERLHQGARLLRLAVPYPAPALLDFAQELTRRNGLPDCILRLTLTRGSGPRGYAIRHAGPPTLVMSLHPPPARQPRQPPAWRLVTSSIRIVTGDPLATVKTLAKLPQILARVEADDRGADEALLVNTDGCAVEGSSSNLFWVDQDTINTPPLASGALAGVTRTIVLELCAGSGLPVQERTIRPEALREADGVFCTLSTLGVVEAAVLDDQPLRQSPRTAELRDAYWELVAQETQGRRQMA